MTYLLDTNICAYLLKGTFPALNEKILTVHPTQLAISAVTLYELEYGAAKACWGEERRQRLKLFLSAFTIAPFDDRDAVAAGQIRAALEKQGCPIGAYDLQIAAQGLCRQWVVVTHNTGEFQRVPGLKLEDWTE